MARELLLLRHGKSDWSGMVEDYYRPLKDRGKRAAQRIGTWLWQQDIRPDYLLSSPAQRALGTAEKTAKAMGLTVERIHYDARIYEASVSTLLQVLADCPAEAQRVMLVGHNPGFEDLLLYLTDRRVARPVDGKWMPTATLARLRMPDHWQNCSTGCATLLSLTRPKSLPKLFPYPAPHGHELRARPAYYYSQSSVIPYRIHEGQLQVLVVASSQRRHWVFPKGVQEPGLSLADSAAKESREEAGVIGEVDALALGEYRYEKWDAQCNVTVYAQKVTGLIDESEWEESHRGRFWLSPQVAAQKLKQQELIPLIERLMARVAPQYEL